MIGCGIHHGFHQGYHMDPLDSRGSIESIIDFDADGFRQELQSYMWDGD